MTEEKEQLTILAVELVKKLNAAYALLDNIKFQYECEHDDLLADAIAKIELLKTKG